MPGCQCLVLFRRKRMRLTKQTTDDDLKLEELGSRCRKTAHSVALRFRHLGNKKYEVLKEQSSTEEESWDDIIDASSQPFCAIKTQVTNVEMTPLESTNRLEYQDTERIQGHLPPKVCRKRPKHVLNKTTEKRRWVGNNVEDSLLLFETVNNCESQKTKDIEPYPCLELFDSEQLSLKVSDMVKSRFKDEELDDAFLQPSSPLVREFVERNETDEDEERHVESEENEKVVVEGENFQLRCASPDVLNSKINSSNAPKCAKKPSLVLSQISVSSENSQENSPKLSSPHSFPMRSDAEKENQVVCGENTSQNQLKICKTTDGKEHQRNQTIDEPVLGNDGEEFHEPNVGTDKVSCSTRDNICGTY